MDLPIFRISTATSRALVSGIYVFTGSSACTITLPNLNPATLDASDPRVMAFKNEGSAGMTIQSASGNIFDGVSGTSIVLAPGESCVLAPENAYYAVLARSGVTKMPTASRPAWSSTMIGYVYFDTTTNKLVMAGAAAWETVTSA